MSQSAVYLLHFARPYKHARHYLGYTSDLNKRLKRHARGDGSPLIKAVIQARIQITLVRVWYGVDGNYEQHLKKTKNASRFCPYCGGNKT